MSNRESTASRITASDESAVRATRSIHQDTLNQSTVDFLTVTKLCRRGLPPVYRPTFWKLIMGFYPLKSSKWASVEERAVSEYDRITSSICEIDEDGCITCENELTRIIDLDIPRTMPDLVFFTTESGDVKDAHRESGGHVDPEKECCGVQHYTRTQKALKRIIYMIASVNKGLGYVQGMNEFVGLLLYAFCEESNEHFTRHIEASTFFCFQTLLTFLGDDFCRLLDDDHTTGVISTVRHFDNVVRFFDPELFYHLEKLGVCAEQYALRWIMLLFIQEFNIVDSLRVWDFLLSFGDQLRNTTMFVAAAMIHSLRDILLQQDSLSDVIPMLHHFPEGNVNPFLKIAMRWILKYGIDFTSKIKRCTVEEIIDLRCEHGLEKRGLKKAVSKWVSTFWGEE
ncbi:GTPase activator-like protein [Strigomonas culicis]|uniref:GTPase activator-like protein n=2 Tax=Strigomonas culicis TaxID=28005 RepID=S9VTP2_9TRYP|nr:GTPase activator-like protein [Strigomonas culicis]EPY30531.1 GTPase activator-like protein [Strigomonas culicis]|eukprot:EPY28478.1 GTPase activator-like protein [Strigomonas culicis]